MTTLGESGAGDGLTGSYTVKVKLSDLCPKGGDWAKTIVPGVSLAAFGLLVNGIASPGGVEFTGLLLGASFLMLFQWPSLNEYDALATTLKLIHSLPADFRNMLVSQINRRRVLASLTLINAMIVGAAWAYFSFDETGLALASTTSVRVLSTCYYLSGWCIVGILLADAKGFSAVVNFAEEPGVIAAARRAERTSL